MFTPETLAVNMGSLGSRHGCRRVPLPPTVIDAVDPFIGTGVTDLGEPNGLAATWWWPKPQVGNTHPGPTYPFGMVSACAYSGAYPTGYGLHDMSTEGIPRQIHDRSAASGFTHFQQSGTGAIRKYYNYVRVSPMVGPLDELGRLWLLEDETAEVGYYTANLETGIRAELTVGPKSAVHRYTFPSNPDARVVIDFSLGGLAIEHGATVPTQANLETRPGGVGRADIMVEGVPLAVHLECLAPEWRQMLWYDRRLMPGGTRLDFDHIRPTTLRPFGIVLKGPTEPGQTIELRMGFSLRGGDQAEANLRADCGQSQNAFDERRHSTRRAWRDQLGRIQVEGGTSERRATFATALYHSTIKPCFAPDESPFWVGSGPFVFDICTMWDIYKTQLPLLTALDPERAVELANALLLVCEQEGNLPIGYRMARGADRFSRQGSALAHTFFADLCALGLPGIDWDWALVHLHSDLRRTYGEDFLENGLAHPISHTLDLAMAYYCTATIARTIGDDALAGQFEAVADRWSNAFDSDNGLLRDSTFYEGGKWNYSFRLLHEMAGRIEMAGGELAFKDLLDLFFGFGLPAVKQLGTDPTADELAAGYALDRFEGLNNEPDMEAPWAYHYIGRPDLTATVVHSILTNQFGVGPGGLPGNDDSGGLSSWFVWASLGLFPAAGQGIFFLNAPSFRRSQINLGDRRFIIETTGFKEPTRDGAPQFIQSARLNGESLQASWIRSSDLHRGGRLQLVLGPEPSLWGTDTRPPSVSTQRS